MDEIEIINMTKYSGKVKNIYMKQDISKTDNERTYEKNINDFDSLSEYLNNLKNKAGYFLVSGYLNQEHCILDCGFGSGYGSKLLNNYKTYYGVDVSEDAVKYANRKYGNENVKYLKINTDSILPFSDNTFDFVISLQVIEHVKDPLAYLKEIKRVLKENSKAIIATPNRLLRLYKFQKPANKYHLKEYSPKGFLNLVQKVFNKIETKGVFATEEIMKIEIARGRKKKNIFFFTRQIIEYLITGICKLIGINEAQIINALKKFWQSIFIRKKERVNINKSDWNSFRVEDFSLSDKSLDKSLDLFFIVTK